MTERRLSGSPESDSGVLVVGGGLAGLALATYLGRAGREPVIAEQRAAWGDGGYGIGLWTAGQSVLADLGLLSTVRRAATDPREVAVRASGGDLLTRTSLPAGRSLMLAVHRADLHAALREEVPESWLLMGTAVTDIEERRTGVAVTFDDGSTETFDLVVGADGVHSTVREQCFTDWTLREHDTYVWSLWAQQDVDIGPEMVSVWGRGSEGFVARVGDRVGFNLAARCDDPGALPARETLRDCAADIGWKLPALLDGTDEAPFFDRVRDVRCPRWHTDRVVLVGDAAHAVHPISGMGASLALQDARVLAAELRTADGPPEQAFRRYEQRRRPETTRVRRTARAEAAFMLADAPLVCRLRNELVRRTPLFEWFLERQLQEAV